MVLANFFSYLNDHPGILVVMFLMYSFIYALSLLFSGPKPERNPFSIKYVRSPPGKLVTDQKERDKVLKQRFKREKVPDNLDAIVIGSGIGGMSTAVLLGRAGQKVLVLEQHDQAGGCCHTFTDKGYEFDTGIHYVGKMVEGERTKALIDQITEGQVIWAPMDREFDNVAIGTGSKAKKYCMRSGTREEFAENLKTQFPSEKQAIDKLMKLLDEAKSIIDMGLMIPKLLPLKLAKILIKTGIFNLLCRRYLKMCGTSVKEALDEISDNKEFKGVLCYIFGDLGVPPSQLGILEYAQLINHYIPGAFYPVGGTSEIAFQIITIIERLGGRVLVDAPVTKILVNDKGQANGVTVHKSSGDINIFAKRIISSVGVMNTFKYLLPRTIAQKAPLFPLIDKVGPSVSNMTVFVGLNGSSSDLGLKAGNTWAFTSEDLDKHFREYMSMTVEEAAESDCPMMFISFPSAKDPNWELKYPGKSVCLLINLIPSSWFREWKDGRVKHRGEDYNSLKEKIGLRMWRRTEELFPKLAGKMDYIDIGTSLSNKYYLGQPEGEIYGLDHSIKCRFHPEISMHLRPESGISELYLTGQDVISAGFSAALSAGVLTAGAILHRNLFNDLSALTKETKRLCDEKKRHFDEKKTQ